MSQWFIKQEDLKKIAKLEENDDTVKQEPSSKKVKKEEKGKGIRFNLKTDHKEWLIEPEGKKKIRNIKNMEDKNKINIILIDSGGGLPPTITKTAWKILSRTERKVQF